MRERFEYEERTEHKGVAPAKYRLQSYKVKRVSPKNYKNAFGKPPTTALPGARSRAMATA